MLKKKSKKLKNQIQNSNQKVTYSYEQTPYAGRIAVFETSHATEEAWSKLALGGLDFRVVEGTHLDIFHEPNVQNLAAELADTLALVQDGVQVKSLE